MISWTAMIVLGFALIYWTVFPELFQLRTVNQPTPADAFWWCVYYSMEMLTTLGLGDIQPTPNWLRIVSGANTLIGFSVVTASVTWIILLFPALRRTRTLARHVHALQTAEQQTGVAVVSAGMHVILAGLAEEVVRARVDLIHFPVLFYFYTQDARASLARAVFPLMRFAEQGREAGRDDLVRITAAALRLGLADLAEVVGTRLGLENSGPEEVFRAFSQLHLHSTDAS